eukprot:10144624-Lingulodinium_polyedra.AAC.1
MRAGQPVYTNRPRGRLLVPPTRRPSIRRARLGAAIGTATSAVASWTDAACCRYAWRRMLPA